MLKLRFSNISLFRFRHKLNISQPHWERAEAAAAHGATARAAPTLPTAAAAAESAAAAQPVWRRGSREEERVHAGVRGGARRQAQLRGGPHGRVTDLCGTTR